MDFNPSKWKFLKIINKKLALHFNYHINNELIRKAKHVKYLGITIDSCLTWTEHVNVLSHKANATLPLLRCNLKPCLGGYGRGGVTVWLVWYYCAKPYVEYKCTDIVSYKYHVVPTSYVPLTVFMMIDDILILHNLHFITALAHFSVITAHCSGDNPLF